MACNGCQARHIKTVFSLQIARRLASIDEKEWEHKGPLLLRGQDVVGARLCKITLSRVRQLGETIPTMVSDSK